MKTIILAFSLVLLIGCGSSSSTKDPVVNATNNDAPKSPVTKGKGTTPPSIPVI
jgi:hypothetical protein